MNDFRRDEMTRQHHDAFGDVEDIWGNRYDDPIAYPLEIFPREEPNERDDGNEAAELAAENAYYRSLSEERNDGLARARVFSHEELAELELADYPTKPTRPAKLAPRDIRVVFSTLDRYRKVRRFKTLKGAQAFAQERIGEHPDMSAWYAVGAYGDAKIEVEGATLAELFPAVTKEGATA